jgi:hypothetical protein
VSPPWLVEGARILAPVVYLGRVEDVTPSGRIDRDFVMNRITFNVEAVFRPHTAHGAGRHAHVSCPALTSEEPPLVEGGILLYHTFVTGEAAVIFAGSWGEDLRSLFAGRSIIDQTQEATEMLTGLTPRQLSALKATEEMRVAQRELYQRIMQVVGGRKPNQAL